MLLDPGVHGPEAPVAGAISQVLRGVGRAEEHAPAGDILHMAPIGGPEAVRPQAEELLDTGHVGTSKGVQLADFHQPHALQ